RTALGERHPDYATSLNNLAGLYGELGRHAEAEPLLVKAMEIRRTALGERHPHYASSLNSLAELYRATGRHAETELLARQGLPGDHAPEEPQSLALHLAQKLMQGFVRKVRSLFHSA